LRLILRVWPTCSEGDDEFNFAYVDLDEGFVKSLLHKMTRAAEFKRREGASFFAIQTWDCSATYCSNPPDGFEALFGETWVERFKEDEWALQPETFVIQKYEEQRTEMNVLCVSPDDLWWEAVPKHGDSQLNTSRVTVKMLKAILARLRGKHLKKPKRTKRTKKR
jgi:hypothetical protein